jgi:outer membrane protease
LIDAIGFILGTIDSTSCTARARASGLPERSPKHAGAQERPAARASGLHRGAPFPACLALACLALAPPAAAELPTDETTTWVRAGAGAYVGSNVYALHQRISIYTVRSELTWPLTAPALSIDAGFARQSRYSKPWSLELHLGGSLLSPAGNMVDRDWLADYAQELEFSHTDSSVQGHFFEGDLTFRRGLSRRQAGDGSLWIDLVLGYRHEFAVLDAYGATGWQLDQNLQQAPVTLDPNLHALHYKVHKLLPHVGFGLHGRWEGFSFEADLGAGVAWSYDDDDHLLRHKEGTAWSRGFAFLARASPRWEIVRQEGGARWALGCDLFARYMNADGTLTQQYYAEDPSLPAGQTPTVPIYSDFSSTSLLFAARAVVEARF